VKRFLKQALPRPASVALIFLLALGFGGCGQESTPDEAAPAAENAGPQDETDVALNNYEKLVKEYSRVARKHQGGDVSVTMLYIDLRHQTEAATAKLQQQKAQMKPVQAHRFAKLFNSVQPYLQG
jgi:hypothetical protein